MKCPKCSYLGFETGDRCKNCGYDFSLLTTHHDPPDADLAIRVPDQLPAGADTTWMDRLHSSAEDVAEADEMPESALADAVAEPIAPQVQKARGESVYPLFAPSVGDDDEPLIKLPTVPRAPLSVRRTPEQPRLRSTRPERDEAGLSLEFAEETAAPASPPVIYRSFAPAATVAPAIASAAPIPSAVSGLGRRAAAGLTDHAILLGIDFVVVYSTLRMAALSMGDWQQLPPLPMLTFLLLLKLAYFGAFTAACGQTIGKMAARIRVVADDASLDPTRAVRRTFLAGFSMLAFGAGFIPALLDPDRRALHDRIARTRVVELPSV